jgi:hypothetical protein
LQGGRALTLLSASDILVASRLFIAIRRDNRRPSVMKLA